MKFFVKVQTIEHSSDFKSPGLTNTTNISALSLADARDIAERLSLGSQIKRQCTIYVQVPTRIGSISVPVDDLPSVCASLHSALAEYRKEAKWSETEDNY